MGVKCCGGQEKIVRLRTQKVFGDEDNVINNFNYEDCPYDYEERAEAINNEKNPNKETEPDKKIIVESEQKKEEKPPEPKKELEMQHNEVEFQAVEKQKPAVQEKEPPNYSSNLEKIESVREEKSEPKEEEHEVLTKSKVKKPQKFPDIFSIIPEKVILNCDSSELLYLSDLKKMININMKERVKYSDRFCMVTKENFFIYNSKENYITLKRPLAVLPINQITRVVLFKLNQKDKVYNHFYVCFDKNKSTELIYVQINTFFMNTHPESENSDSNESQALIIFKSDNEDIIKKWYVVLDYLVKNYKTLNQTKENSEGGEEENAAHQQQQEDKKKTNKET